MLRLIVLVLLTLPLFAQNTGLSPHIGYVWDWDKVDDPATKYDERLTWVPQSRIQVIPWTTGDPGTPGTTIVKDASGQPTITLRLDVSQLTATLQNFDLLLQGLRADLNNLTTTVQAQANQIQGLVDANAALAARIQALEDAASGGGGGPPPPIASLMQRDKCVSDLITSALLTRSRESAGITAEDQQIYEECVAGAPIAFRVDCSIPLNQIPADLTQHPRYEYDLEDGGRACYYVYEDIEAALKKPSTSFSTNGSCVTASVIEAGYTEYCRGSTFYVVRGENGSCVPTILGYFRMNVEGNG